MDCQGVTKVISTVMLEVLEQVEAKKNVVNPKEAQAQAGTKESERPIILTRGDEEPQTTPSVKELKQQSKKPAPKIEVLDEKLDYQSMVKHSSFDPTTRKFELSVELDSINSISEVNLDISARRMIVTSKANAAVLFEYDMPRIIDPDSTSAKWNKKKQQLTIAALSAN